MRLTSPSTRIIGGRPADKCRSEARCLAAKARSSVISMGFPDGEAMRDIPQVMSRPFGIIDHATGR